jgi:galactokinase
MDTKFLETAYSSYFNAKPEFVVRAPGRVNLIGEHTDYNDGFVLPMAIDRAVWMALTPRADSRVHVHSLDYGTDSTFDLDSLTREKGWGEYIKGVAHQLRAENHHLRGFNAVMTGDIPRGAGLSSSAAVELAAARAFSVTSNIEWDAKQMARLAQKAENEWVGVNCGIMDQMASAASKSGYALFLDCRSLEIQHAPLPENAAVVILDTSTRRGLVESAYNERRSQCEEAARTFGVKALRDVECGTWGVALGRGLSEVVMKRARHIITENARVLEAVKAMKAGDVNRLGELFNASHESLRDDFEVTNDALNIIVECAREQTSCYGARMTGAGFGGCAVALVKKEKAEDFASAVSALYKERSGLDASVYVCQASEGAEVCSIS